MTNHALSLIITVEMCSRHSSCPIGFERTFPNGLELTKANWDKLIKSDLDWQWLTALLTGSALAEYEKVTDPAWVEYEKVMGRALFAALLQALNER